MAGQGAGNLAVIPAKARSTRLPGKNLAILAGRPLVVRAVEVAVSSGLFEVVMVSTDDDDIASHSRQAGAEVPFRRDEALAGDTVEVPAVARDALLWYLHNRGRRFEWVCILQPTSPLRRAEDISNALRCAEQNAQAEAVVSVSRFSHHPYWALRVDGAFVVPDKPDCATASRQNLPDLCHPDGTVLWWRSAALLASLNLYDCKVVPYFTPPEAAVDIDHAADLRYAEWMLSSGGEHGQR